MRRVSSSRCDRELGRGLERVGRAIVDEDESGGNGSEEG